MKEGRQKQLVRAGWTAALIAVISLSTGCAVVRRVIKFPFWLITAEVEDTGHPEPMGVPAALCLHEETSPLLIAHIMPEFQPAKKLPFRRLAGNDPGAAGSLRSN